VRNCARERGVHSHRCQLLQKVFTRVLLTIEHGVWVLAPSAPLRTRQGRRFAEIDARDQPRVACQLPLHLSPVMIPLHRPLPELPASRPLPVATDAPTEILTETLPRGLIPPVTLPPPADERWVPATLKGTVWLELQLPARVAKVTFQVPSKTPGRAIAACAPEGADIAAAPKMAAAKIDRRALGRPKLAEVAIGWAEMDMFSLF